MIGAMIETTTILLSTGSIFHLPLADVFRATRESGFNGVELLLGPELAHVSDDQISRSAEQHGVPIRCVHAPFFAQSGLDEDYFCEIERTIELARAVHAAMVNAHPFGLISHPEQARRLVELASDIALATENMPQGIDISNADEAAVVRDHEALNDFARANGLKMTYDVTHFATWGKNILAGHRIFEPTMINIHVSDYIAGYQHLLPGRGELPLRELLHTARADGAAEFVTLEVAPDSFSRRDYAHVVEALTAAREFVQRGLAV